jgi:hypothetical protein
MSQNRGVEFTNGDQPRCAPDQGRPRSKKKESGAASRRPCDEAQMTGKGAPGSQVHAHGGSRNGWEETVRGQVRLTGVWATLD